MTRTHEDNLDLWQHSHSFGQQIKRPGEVRTLIVIALTSSMMVVEIGAGLLYGSMALLADGLHMGAHTVALSINAFAYIYARRQAHKERFSFGTGKVNTLGGFTGAMLLAGFAVFMAWESVARLLSPVEIAFNQAIFVAGMGLIVNGVSVYILGHSHGSEPDHDPAAGPGAQIHGHAHLDHNLLAAYLHVLADALISLLAIFALLSAKYLELVWADPAMGIIGAVLVARWSLGLLHSTAQILLDRAAPEELRAAVRDNIESRDDNRVVDLHIWAVGPGIYSAIVAIVTHHPQPPDHYKALLPQDLNLVHVTVEVHDRNDAPR
ncbi:MAG: CDF family Co(II)/Ni(II) efflux transporter DmeF [Gammaproteobacteria bacterium]